ncbi:MAG TPA: hypothetical protein VFW92_02115 [Candidatus Limnocylindrales bacterium]|nr:hypothetical protein [Candidatus Limnocylindrales bacterium]
MEIGPAPVLAVLVGLFHASVYLLLSGRLRGRMLLVLPAAILGAFAGQALGARLGDPVRIGDFGLLWSSIVAWLGITIVVVVSLLGPARGGSSLGR